MAFGNFPATGGLIVPPTPALHSHRRRSSGAPASPLRGRKGRRPLPSRQKTAILFPRMSEETGSLGTRTRRRGVFWLAGQWVWMIAAALVPPLCASRSAPFPAAALAALSASWGGCLGLAGVAALGDNRTGLLEPKPKAPLVTTGAYRIVRHPLYASLMFACGGWALFWWNLPGAGAWAGLCLWLWAKARAEERLLRERFPEYAAYAARTGAFIPRIRIFRRRVG